MAEGRRRLLLVGVALAVASPVLLVGTELKELPPPVLVSVRGQVTYVEPDTTLGEAIKAFDLHAESGRLLDVEGKVIEYRADPGQILLNGEPASRSTVLETGSRIETVNGEDRTEGTRVVKTPLEGRRAGNPMYTLGTARVTRIRTEGRISGKVLSIVYKPRSKTKRPPAVALTFDDGPWPNSTGRILSILKRMHVKATFFVVGYLAKRYPQLVRREIRAGMTVANHSWSHPNSPEFKRLRPHRIATEMSRTNRLLRRRFGVKAELFRAPGGSYDGEVIQTARRLGLRLVQWDVDPSDWSSSATRESIVRRVLSRVRPGSIVLLHDGGGDQSVTVAALPEIIRGIRKMGLRLVTIGR